MRRTARSTSTGPFVFKKVSSPTATDGSGAASEGATTLDDASPSTRSRSRAGHLRIAAVLGVVTLLFFAQRLGVLEQLGAPERARDTLRGLGVWGYLAFVVSYAALQPFGIPGTVFVVAAALVWPWPIAFALSMIGTMAASVVGFSFARFVARDFLAKRIPARFRKYDAALERRAFTTVFVLRLVFWMPPLLHAFFGVSRVRFSTHFWGSLAGYVLPLLLVSVFGPRLFELLRSGSVEVWGGMALTAVLVGLGVWCFERRRDAQPAEAAGSDGANEAES